MILGRKIGWAAVNPNLRRRLLTCLDIELALGVGELQKSLESIASVLRSDFVILQSKELIGLERRDEGARAGEKGRGFAVVADDSYLGNSYTKGQHQWNWIHDWGNLKSHVAESV